MPDLVTVMLFATAGLGIYLVGIPFVAMLSPPSIRKSVGGFYGSNAARLLNQFTYTRRVLSGYDVLPISVDAEQKQLKVTLQGSAMPGRGDKVYRFNNPDDRIKRLYKRPAALNYEQVPAAIDGVLAELGHWLQEKQTETGFVRHDDSGAIESVDTTVKVPQGLHICDPIDAFAVVPNSVDPENITTVEQETKKRFEKYGRSVGAKESIAVAVGFLVGVGAVLGMRFFKQKFLGGGGGGGPQSPIEVPMTIMVDLAGVVL